MNRHLATPNKTSLLLVLVVSLLGLAPHAGPPEDPIRYQNNASAEALSISDVALDFSTLIKLAPESDNWPITWAADNHQYTAWGDGWGFDQSSKQSLGVSRLEGGPSDLGGTDVWTSTGKSYGILSYDGTLYMWRSPGSNATNFEEARLYTSTDSGQSWSSESWAFTQSDEIILPSILQAGQEYSAAEDNYVYMYAPRYQGSTSLEAQSPGVIDLFRVPKGSITTRNQYEFFAGFNNGAPQWTSNLSERQPVHSNTSVSWAPPSVIYNPALDKYLMVVDYDAQQGSGSWAVLQADAPWGPWDTVKHFTSDFPNSHDQLFFFSMAPKWTSSDGTVMWLAATGMGESDALLLVEMTLTTDGSPSNASPSVSLNSPTNGATFQAPASITLEASASDSDGTIDGVAFYSGSTKLGEDTSSPYSYTWQEVQAGSYSLTAQATDNDGAVSTSSSITVTVASNDDGSTTTSPLAYWPFEGSGTTINDASGNGYGATIVGATRTSDGHDGNALSFNGTNDRVDLDPIDVSGQAMTITAWFRADDFFTGTPDGDPRIISKADGVYTNDHYWMVSTWPVNGNIYLRYRLKTNGQTTNLVASTGALQTGSWTHVTARYDGSTMRIYKDGVEIARTSKSGSINTDPSVPASIGNNPGGDRPFDGVIDEVRVYDAALSEAEIAALLEETSSSNEPPAVSLTTPSDGSTFQAPASITLEASASDADGSVTKVAFYSGSAKLGEDTSSPYSFSWLDVPAGSYSLSAQATDDDGAVATSSTVGITVEANGVVLISNITVNSGRSYQVGDGGLENGSLLYIDRSYTAVAPPAVVQGLTYIRTANDDKVADTGVSNFLSFDLSSDADVYVLHDDRLGSPPWLADWTDTDSDMESSDSQTIYSIYRKAFSAGTVTLGSNTSDATSGSSMYVVAASPTSISTESLSITNLTVATGKSYQTVTSGLMEGVEVYIDRSYTAVSPVPTEIQGLSFIRTANDDKDADPGSTQFLSFDVSVDVDVYVLHDERLGNPSWLDDWTDTRSDMSISDPATVYSLYRHFFSAGTVTLGSNTADPTNSSSMYVVAIAPHSSNLDAASVDAEQAEKHAVPEEFELTQNYPNPFNPTTTIGFSLSEPADVQLEVFDLLGRRVAVLVDEHRQAGVHNVHFDATGLGSGTYLYRLSSNQIVFTRRMTVVK